MADPISIAGLIVDVGMIITATITYAKAVRDARSDTQKLSEELFALKGILEHLSVHIKPEDSEKLPSYSEAMAFDPELLSSTLKTTHEFLKSLLHDLEEPAGKFKQLKKKLEWPFTQDQFNAYLSRLERVKSWLILVLTSDSAALQRDLHKEITNLASSLEDDLKIRKDERIQTAHKDLFHWLAPVSPNHIHMRASKGRGSQTGAWFIDRTFKDWLWNHGAYRNILFLLGKSGTGKTTLFAHAVDELVSMTTKGQEINFAYFYCTFGDTASQDPVNILGSFVAQLSESVPSILDSIWPLYEENAKNQSHRHPVDLSTLEDAIVKATFGKRPIVLLIDAINESSHMEYIKRSLLKLSSQSSNIRILVTGTAEVISERHASIVYMNASIIRNDIDTFVHYRLEHDDMLRNLSAKLKDEIWRTLVKGADGSFRWAQLSLDSLSTKRTPKAIRKALQTLPGTLRETYVNILERIEPSDWELARAALFWLSFSKRTLTLRELNVAVVLEETCTVFDDDMELVSPRILLQICQGLITQDKFGSVVLAHASIKDFLTSEWISSSRVKYFSLDPTTADQIIMRQCLTYLCLENFRPGATPSSQMTHEREKTHLFLKYAAQFWATHGLSCEFDGYDRELVKRLFDSRHLPNRGNFGVWVQTLVGDVSFESIQSTEPLYYAASFGLVPVVKAILASDPELDINARGGRFSSTPLFVACWRSNYEVAQLLLKAGADPNLVDSSGLTIFSLATLTHNQDLQKILPKDSVRKAKHPGDWHGVPEVFE
ncbi:hypothetical protein N7474_003201 [Penicillium riverlandense]|uniref:uncharacterized protein n=1 Tax=Penicillium riverlandense TaxID=1903569 RepID=UPI0025495CF3|nr:uncharacterized protein N7474_003201 [Penicillium riverlandense]KAJ5826063.1 hypothetical protein N7474_003201 [Penicillium riverlandense]